MSKPDIIVQDRSELGILVHYELDDAGLTPAEFRIYAHLARRAAKQGRAWPGRDSMAGVCCMSKRTVTRAIQSLEDYQMLAVTRAKGQRSIYVLTKRSSWVVPGLSTDPASFGTGATDAPVVVPNRATKSTKKRDKGTFPENGADEKVIHQAIYEAFPKKVGRPAALKAIVRASKSTPAEKLLELTQTYAKAVDGTDPQFIPHPATWFNQERFNDKPETWTHARDKKPRTESSRNVGTANEGRSSQYAGVGKVR